MTYVISDIHGNYQKFRALLSEISFKESDVLYILGDIVDYGDESMELIEDISLRLNVYPVAGEHDYLAVRMLAGFDKMSRTGAAPDADFVADMTEWVKNGGAGTLEGFRALDADAREGVLDYLSEMALFEEVEVGDCNYLLVHAGIADYDKDSDLYDYQPEDFFSAALDPAVELIPGKTVVVGHRPTASGKIERGAGSIFMDCGACEGGKLACLCLESGEEFYA